MVSSTPSTRMFLMTIILAAMVTLSYAATADVNVDVDVSIDTNGKKRNFNANSNNKRSKNTSPGTTLSIGPLPLKLGQSYFLGKGTYAKFSQDALFPKLSTFMSAMLYKRFGFGNYADCQRASVRFMSNQQVAFNGSLYDFVSDATGMVTFINGEYVQKYAFAPVSSMNNTVCANDNTADIHELQYPNDEYPWNGSPLLFVNGGKSVLAAAKYMTAEKGTFYYDYQFSVMDGSFEGMYTNFTVPSGQIYNEYGSYVGEKSNYNMPYAVAGGKTWLGNMNVGDSLVSSDGIYLALPTNLGFNMNNVAASKSVLYFRSYNLADNIKMYSAVTGALLGTTTIPQLSYPFMDWGIILVSSSGDRMFRMFTQSVNNEGWHNLYNVQSFNPATPEDSSTVIIGFGIERKFSCGNGNSLWPNRMNWLSQKTNPVDGSTVHSIGVTWMCYDYANGRQHSYLGVHEVIVKRTVPTPSRPPSLQGRPSGQPTRQPTGEPSQSRTFNSRALKSDERQDASKGKGKGGSKGQGQAKTTSNDKGDAAVDALPKTRSATSLTTSAAAAKRVRTAA